MKKNKGKSFIFKWVMMMTLVLAGCLDLAVSAWGAAEEKNQEIVETEDVTEKSGIDVEIVEDTAIPDNSDPNEETDTEDEGDSPETGGTVTYQIQFMDELGGDLETITVEEGAGVVLPMPTEIDGYRSMGWSEEKNASGVSYIPGETYQITGDLVLYPVRNKLYQLTFLTNTGKTTSRLQALTITGVKGEKVTLPKLPVYQGYLSLGWTVKLRGTTVTNKEKSTYVISGDKTFYQVNKMIHTVTFYSKYGRTEYTSLKEQVLNNEYITLPELPKVEGYKGLGWTTEKGGSSVKYKPGRNVCIKREVQFYGVYQKLPAYTVKFYTYTGGYEYQSLRMKVYGETTITLPYLPVRTNYAGIGWGKVKCPEKASLTAEGKKIKVTGNMKFYGCWEEGKTIQFMWNGGGGEYKSLRMNVTGTTVVLPNLPSPSGYTFLGWSDKPNQKANPKYQMGRKFNVTKNMKLYSVVMKKPMTGIAAGEITVSEKYDTVFFIGDSRTVQLKNAVRNDCGEDSQKVVFFCQNCKHLDWFEENRAAFLKQIKQTKGKKAVIFNLGVNDLYYNSANGYLSMMANQYISVMNSVAKELKKYDCEMYFMSVNPANEKDCTIAGYKRSSKWIQDFNYLVRTGLNGYTYVDTYNYLINTGFELIDGLHYSDETYRKIYWKTIKTIDA